MNSSQVNGEADETDKSFSFRTIDDNTSTTDTNTVNSNALSFFKTNINATTTNKFTPPSTPVPIDIVQQVCGNFGRWQLRTILLIFLCKVPSAWFMACIIYTAPTPQKGDYYCRPPRALMNNFSAGHQITTGDTTPNWIRISPSVSDERDTDRRFYVDACNIYEEQLQSDFVANYGNYTNPFEEPDAVRLANGSLSVKVNVLPCDHFEHNSEYHSLVSQFDLVCSRQLLISVTQSFHGLGAFFGEIFAKYALNECIADSPRWLLHHNKLDKALEQLLNSAAFNNRTIPLNLEEKLVIYAKQIQQKSTNAPVYWSIWEKTTELKYIYCIHLSWVGVIIIHNVMLLMIRSLGKEYIHVNTVCLGLSEILGIYLGLYFILYTRRRWLWCGELMIGSGAVTFLIWCVPSSLKSSRRVGFEMIFWIFLKFSNAVTFAVLATCTGEIVASEKRDTLMFSVLTHSRFWLIFGPYIATTIQIHHLIPITIFASLAVLTGLLLCFLNRAFWNTEQPRSVKVPTPNTYRRNSSLELLRRFSASSASSGGNVNPGFYENGLAISISDLWLVNAQFETIAEQDISAAESYSVSGDKVN
ncbi:uncharacterized protein [Eurosta solidaginis]|uniref:uncharacterized protein isoform X2 n=1 Tax=Eurosta solidaginis TaxID=178769 RepID=UPI003530A83B